LTAGLTAPAGVLPRQGDVGPRTSLRNRPELSPPLERLFTSKTFYASLWLHRPTSLRTPPSARASTTMLPSASPQTVGAWVSHVSQLPTTPYADTERRHIQPTKFFTSLFESTPVVRDTQPALNEDFAKSPISLRSQYKFALFLGFTDVSEKLHSESRFAKGAAEPAISFGSTFLAQNRTANSPLQSGSDANTATADSAGDRVVLTIRFGNKPRRGHITTLLNVCAPVGGGCNLRCSFLRFRKTQRSATLLPTVLAADTLAKIRGTPGRGCSFRHQTWGRNSFPLARLQRPP